MKIVAIGGGNLNLNDEEKPYNLDGINDEIVKLSNKKCPRLLYIGFNIRADFYFSMIKTIFSSKGCQCIYLNFREFNNLKTVECKFKRADIIFLPGGNTLDYMKQTRKYGLDEFLVDAANRGCVMAGISAGAIMCFDAGSSDSRNYGGEKKIYTKVKGIGLENGLVAPHFMTSDRPNDLPRMLKNLKKGTIAFGIDECAALVIDDDNYKIITTKDGMGAYKCYIKNGKYFQEKLAKEGKKLELYKI